MLGRFDGFPQIVQARADVGHALLARKLQYTITDALRDLNQVREMADSDIGSKSVPLQCHYEVGIADGVYFNFLDSEEAERLKRYMKTRTLRFMDFLVAVLYHYRREGGREASLWSDLHYLRFYFQESTRFEIQVHHYRGTRRMPLDSLIKKVVAYINQKARRKGLEVIQLLEIRGH